METIGADQGAGVPETTTSDSQMELVHGWDRTKNVHVYSLLGLSTHKNVKCYPTMTQGRFEGCGLGG